MRIHSVLRATAVALLPIAAAVLASCVPPGRSGAAGGADTARPTVMRVMNLRVHGAGDVASPPILRIPVDGKPSSGLGNDALTVAFEMKSDALPAISLVLVHCDRNWKATENVFVQDPMLLRGNDFEIERAPVGATSYDYIVRATFPQAGYRPSVTYAGNYLARIVDYYDNGRILAETRFFVVEPRASVAMDIASDFYESAQTKVLQNGLKIRVEAVPTIDAFGGRINAIDLYSAGEWFQPIVADENSAPSYEKGEPWVTWLPSLLGKTVAQYANLPAGNEHRLLDLTDLVQYPTTGGILTTPLSDIPRQNALFFDNNGATPDRLVPWSDADYVTFEFRLDLEGTQVKEDVFVVGTFTDWRPLREWQMTFDKITGFYTVRGTIRRAFHEYQYVAGNWDADAEILRKADATLLEGNPRVTTHPYYAFVYYRETAGGGYDKIIGVGLDITGR